MKFVLLFFIKIYQTVLSPFLGTHCRFAPSCSNYATQAIEKKGIIRGIFKSLGRLMRCHPFARGGYDPVR